MQKAKWFAAGFLAAVLAFMAPVGGLPMPDTSILPFKGAGSGGVIECPTMMVVRSGLVEWYAGKGEHPFALVFLLEFTDRQVLEIIDLNKDGRIDKILIARGDEPLHISHEIWENICK